MVNQVMRFVNDEEGATAIEYGLLAALIAAALVATVGTLNSGITAAFDRATNELNASAASAS